jgi:hypothetical protein
MHCVAYNKPSFWALRMFDAINSYPVPNPLNRYVIGSDYLDMKLQCGWIVDPLPAGRQSGER